MPPTRGGAGVGRPTPRDPADVAVGTGPGSGSAPNLPTIRSGTPPPHVRSEVARILVVDDDPSIRTLVAAVLESEDTEYEVETAEDGTAAVARLSDEDRPAPDAVVLDVMMPGLDGFEVLAWIRATTWLYDLPVVMLTARTAHEDEVDGFHRGCDAYVRKPFEPTDLTEVLAGVLQAGPELRIARRRQRLVELLQGDLPLPLVDVPDEDAETLA